MSGLDVSEKDWKLFRKRLPDWQDDYMDRLNREYIALLNGPGAAAERFWQLEKRIRKDKMKVGVSAEMSRSKMIWNLLSLLQEGAVSMEDLDGFSEDLREKLVFMMYRGEE